MHPHRPATLAKCICGLFFAAALLPSCRAIKNYTERNNYPVHNRNRPATDPLLSGNKSIVEKYADYLKVAPENLANIKLYVFIDKWMNTPYKWGGSDESGVDCSGFLQRLYTDVYELKLPRTSEQLLASEQVKTLRPDASLSEGDIVFFRTMPNTNVSHVGLYLQNNMFISSTTSKGVVISSLDNTYWKRCFVTAGRVSSRDH